MRWAKWLSGERSFSWQTREIRNEKTIVMFAVTDFTDTIKAKVFTKNERLPELLDQVKGGGFHQDEGRCHDGSV